MAREIIIDGDIARVPLTRGFVAIIDAEDVERVAGRNWSAAIRANGRVYAMRVEREKAILLHRFLISPPAGMDIDHANGDALDNRKSNLRVATRSENNANARLRKDNAAGFKGVICKGRKWRAEIAYYGTRCYIGAFNSPEEAHSAYVAASKELYGEFSRAK